jgi:hypothetical protein
VVGERLKNKVAVRLLDQKYEESRLWLYPRRVCSAVRISNPCQSCWTFPLPGVYRDILGIGKAGRHASCRNLFKDLIILPLPCLYISEVVCCVRSNTEKMKHNEEVHDHCTRQKSDFHIQFRRTKLFKNSTANVGVKLYNKFPNTIKRLEKIQEFKRRLKYFLLQHIFCSVDEYVSSIRFASFLDHYFAVQRQAYELYRLRSQLLLLILKQKNMYQLKAITVISEGGSGNKSLKRLLRRNLSNNFYW